MLAPAAENVSLSQPRTPGNHFAFFVALLARGFIAEFVDDRFALCEPTREALPYTPDGVTRRVSE